MKWYKQNGILCNVSVIAFFTTSYRQEISNVCANERFSDPMIQLKDLTQQEDSESS